ncbi:DegQ family serine endoprotease [Oceanibaculum pacificum]|uniref:Probable periplasmic serine endoprotease DegP-like n=1 Tax=Oceanibaculum pacificum TaxID=580166 RepID=A0A154V6Y3_9PROT|nr:DegQ family serine endoprotease [Oceanibaculum pacificum]KZC97009.1 hypothetical protein AUP43_15345 [Oceanibaculum pacificum]
MFHKTFSSVSNRRKPAAARWSRRVAFAASGVIVWTAATAASAQVATDYADLAEKVTPAVVNISSTQEAKPAEGQPMPFAAPPGSPMEEFMKRFFEQMPQQRGGQPTTALGSGFIVDPEGYIVTNNHVIDGADKVSVKLPDGRDFDATVVGTDPQTDVALLKVKSDKALPFVSFGDSEKLRVGQAVLAVGNPFGLGGTVTAGIVSARGRDIHSGPYDDFIQTDAAINRGNSGGPMFNMDGQVVGVNSAIYSPNGGSVGIGFAIPANMVKQVVADLKTHGQVERGWLGVSIQPVTDDIAGALGMDEPKGALVASVSPDSPADKAKLKAGDVIVGYDGAAVGEVRDLPRLVAATPAGKSVEMQILRDGARRTVSTEIAKLKPQQTAAAEVKTDSVSGLGVTLSSLTEATRQRLDLAADATGVVITAVDPNGKAARQGLRPGDVIEKVGDIVVSKPGDVQQALSDGKRKAALLLINRAGDKRFVAIQLA